MDSKKKLRHSDSCSSTSWVGCAAKLPLINLVLIILPSLQSAGVQGSNAELRDRVHELSSQAEAAQAQAAALQGLQSSLQDSAGPSVDALVQAAIGRERALQDTRNKKVLELLNSKVCHASKPDPVQGMHYRCMNQYLHQIVHQVAWDDRVRDRLLCPLLDPSCSFSGLGWCLGAWQAS